MLEGNQKEKLQKIFMPQYLRRIGDVQQDEKRMVHYTSAANAINILKSKEFWLRSVRRMDDFTEVRYGIGLFKNFAKSERFEAFQNAFGERKDIFLKAINKCMDQFDKCISRFDEGVYHFDEGVKLFDVWEYKTYICCLTEHMKEDLPNGRISMWNGYAKDNGVAFVFKPNSFVNSSDCFRVYTSPVEYLDQNSFNEIAAEVQANVERENRDLEAMDSKDLEAWIIDTIQAAVVSIKRPLFREEQEWRVVATADRLAALKRETECINGIPQVVVKQPLTNEGENTEKGFSLAENLEYMIIGPTPHPHTIADALVWELEKYGIKEPWKRIKCTGIPPGA